MTPPPDEEPDELLLDELEEELELDDDALPDELELDEDPPEELEDELELFELELEELLLVLDVDITRLILKPAIVAKSLVALKARVISLSVTTILGTLIVKAVFFPA